MLKKVKKKVGQTHFF